LKAIEDILAEYIDAIRAADERRKELDASQKLIRTEISFDETSKREAKAETNRQHGIQTSIRWAAWAAFAAAFLYAGFALIQVEIMQTQTAQIFRQAEIENANASSEFAQSFRQLLAFQDQARALQQSAATIRRQWIDDQKPLVTAPIIKPITIAEGQPMMFNVYFANYGKSPALKASGKGMIFIGKDAVKDADEWFRTDAPKPMLHAPTAIIPPGVPATDPKGNVTSVGVFSTAVSKKRLTKDDILYIKTHDLGFVIVMREQYFDSLGNKYWTDGCWSSFMSGAIPECPQGHNEVH